MWPDSGDAWLIAVTTLATVIVATGTPPGEGQRVSDDAGASPRRKRTTRASWREYATSPEPYDPLKLENLARSIETQMLQMEPEPITDVQPMFGAGIYAIYYVGHHPLYEPISDDCRTPIYVGKAVHKGGRKGLVSSTENEAPLWERINEHKTSLEQAYDLDAREFQVRYLVAVDFYVSLAEQLMIRQFRPLWNTVVDGFGNHSPGTGRGNQRRSPWDELHPGRPWSAPDRMPTPSRQSAEQSRLLIERRWSELDDAPVDPPDLPGFSLDET
ncbi:Eco29kI family restriction endonuclease [Streptomyces sp. 900105245]